MAVQGNQRQWVHLPHAARSRLRDAPARTGGVVVQTSPLPFGSMSALQSSHSCRPLGATAGSRRCRSCNRADVRFPPGADIRLSRAHRSFRRRFAGASRLLHRRRDLEPLQGGMRTWKDHAQEQSAQSQPSRRVGEPDHRIRRGGMTHHERAEAWVVPPVEEAARRSLLTGDDVGQRRSYA